MAQDQGGVDWSRILRQRTWTGPVTFENADAIASRITTMLEGNFFTVAQFEAYANHATTHQMRTGCRLLAEPIRVVKVQHDNVAEIVIQDNGGSWFGHTHVVSIPVTNDTHAVQIAIRDTRAIEIQLRYRDDDSSRTTLYQIEDHTV